MTLPNLSSSLTRQQQIENINYVLSAPDRDELLDIAWLKDLLVSIVNHTDDKVNISTINSYIAPTTPSQVIKLYISSIDIPPVNYKAATSQLFQCFIDNISTTIFQNQYWTLPEYPSKIMNDYFYTIQYYYAHNATFEAGAAFTQTDYAGLPTITNSVTLTCVIKFIEMFRLSIAQFEALRNWRASTIEKQQAILTDIIVEMTAIKTHINSLI